MLKFFKFAYQIIICFFIRSLLFIIDSEVLPQRNTPTLAACRSHRLQRKHQTVLQTSCIVLYCFINGKSSSNHSVSGVNVASTTAPIAVITTFVLLLLLRKHKDTMGGICWCHWNGFKEHRKEIGRDTDQRKN